MKNIKRILAIICIIILLGLYIVTFIMALTDNSATMSMFKGCVACTIFVPVVAYVYICVHRYAMRRSGRDPSGTFADGNASSDGEKDK